MTGSQSQIKADRFVFFPKPLGHPLIRYIRGLLLNKSVYVIHVFAECPLQGDGNAVSTWCSEWQPIVQTSGFGGDEQTAEDTKSNDEGKENHSGYRETHKSPKTIRHRAKTSKSITLQSKIHPTASI